MLTKLQGQIRRHIILTNATIIMLEIIVATMVWYFGGAEKAFQTVSNYVFLCASVVIASVAAVNSILASVTAHDSLMLTRDSLELTRATQRPFLAMINTKIIFAQTKSRVEIIVTNTGSLPANAVSIEMTLLRIEDLDREIQLGSVLLNDSVEFPQTNHLVALTIPDAAFELYRTLARAGKLRTRLIMKYHHPITGEILESVFVLDIVHIQETEEYYFRPNTTLSSWS